jgi:hypothetical protein
MSNLADPAFSRGDLMRRLTVVEDRIRQLETARRLEAATIGRGGINVRGGSIVIMDAAGAETMRLSTAGLTLTGILRVLGEIQVTGQSIVVFDPGGQEIFRAGSDGLSLRGVLDVLGSIQVAGGGDITVTDGRLVARDGSGDVFRVDPGVPEIFMRKALLSDLVNEIVEELLTSAAGIELAQFVNAQLIQTAVSAGQTTTSSTTFGDGSSAGPQVTGVQITSTGRCLVLWGASIDAGPRTDGGQIGANMSVAISGATTIAADITRTYQTSQSVTVTGATSWSHRIGGRALTGHLFEGLNAGTHTISGKYATGVSGETVAFANRLIIAIAY